MIQKEKTKHHHHLEEWLQKQQTQYTSMGARKNNIHIDDTWNKYKMVMCTDELDEFVLRLKILDKMTQAVAAWEHSPLFKYTHARDKFPRL